MLDLANDYWESFAIKVNRDSPRQKGSHASASDLYDVAYNFELAIGEWANRIEQPAKPSASHHDFELTRTVMLASAASLSAGRTSNGSVATVGVSVDCVSTLSCTSHKVHTGYLSELEGIAASWVHNGFPVG